MILYKGRLFDNSHQKELLLSLKEDIYSTLKKCEFLTPDIVINACDVLYWKVMNHEYDDIALPLLKSLDIPYELFERYASYFSKDGLEKKVNIELGNLINGEYKLDENNVASYSPLGIIFHIAAGNVDLLPAYSVIEGLLTGNINILKLPSGDNGLSVKLLMELISIEPRLSEFVYVFDVPSTEIATIKQLSDLSDATVVWGGDVAHKAAREFVDIHSSLIVWGHKISFSYIDHNVSDKELTDLAYSICISNQLFCSSCQGIYLNTNSDDELFAFAERFLDILANVSKETNTLPLTMKARNTINNYNSKLEGDDSVLTSNGVSVVIKKDSKLELSSLFQNVWVKKLPDTEIVNVLKPMKSLLQTASINNELENKEQVIKLLMNSGICRIVNLGDNSRMLPGEAHDGEYPLRRYIKIVERIK